MWKDTITRILEFKGEAIGWRFIRLNPIISKDMESVVDSNDFIEFLHYLIQRRDIDNCSDDELGCLAMLHTAFQKKIEKEIGKKSPDFVAIDFEHAMPKKHTVCSVGIVTVKDGVIVDEYISLIKPPNNEYGIYNTKVHRLSSIDTENAKSFTEVFPEIEKRLKGNIVVAHNAESADRPCLEQAMYHNGIVTDLNIRWIDTCDICKAKLEVICDVCNIPLENHHEALDDTRACARIYLMHLNNTLPIEEIIAANEIAKATKKSRRPLGHGKIEGEVLKPNLDVVENPDNPFYGKKVVVSGTYTEWPNRKDLAVLLKNYGADIDTSVTSRTNILCTGAGVGPKKLEKMQKNQADGRDAMILNEEEILEMLVDCEFDKQQ